ncbi:hypothetical protein SPIRO4BDMA_40240 [uncultured spirochete]|uniref:Xylose isomerase-like TIM barrel domain-containing protein n=1 Tax=uncultured spirochete TaxID=156406 RepID=A0A3P3XN05_9SPIR|nr:hypothetical protein SPIRO4BDMA_40240 [uncultured spirochete]
MTKVQYGVSPAFFISLFGDKFTPDDVCEAMPIVRRLGFGCFQAELVNFSSVDLWMKGGAEKVKNHATEMGLLMSQFVAHFMIEAFADENALFSDFGIEEMRKVFDIAGTLRKEAPITVAIGPYRSKAYDQKARVRAYARLIEKLSKIAQDALRLGLKLALEIQPGTLLEPGANGILKAIRDIGSGNVGYNLDTGHAWAAGNNVALYPEMLDGHIEGTHLCDNFGRENLSLRPGAGNIDFGYLIPALVRSKYDSSLDLEIFVPRDKVEKEYSAGLAFVKKLVEA